MSKNLYVAKTERANINEFYTDSQYVVASSLKEAAEAFPNADSVALLSKSLRILKS